MEPVYEEYLRYLGELSGLLEKMTGTVKTKAAAAKAGDLVKMEACMKQEQVYSMSLRGMDQKRDKMHKAMGVEDMTLSQVAEHFPLERRGEAAKAAELAMNRFEEYMSASNVARTTMEVVLREIDRMFPEDLPQPVRPAPGDPPPRMKTDFRA